MIYDLKLSDGRKLREVCSDGLLDHERLLVDRRGRFYISQERQIPSGTCYVTKEVDIQTAMAWFVESVVPTELLAHFRSVLASEPAKQAPKRRRGKK